MRSRFRSLLTKSKNFLRHRSLQFTISITFTIVSVLGMLLVGVSLSMRFISSSEQMTMDSNKRMVDQVDMNLDTYLRNMLRISDSMYYGVLKKADLMKDDISPDMDLLYDTNRDQLISVGVFAANGQMIAAEPITQIKPRADVSGQPWFLSAAKQIENCHFSTPHVENLYVDPDNKYHWVVSLSRSVELTSAGSTAHGVLLVDMNFSGIEQICKSVDFGDAGYLYLTDGSGEIIYHPRQQLIYSNLIRENNLVESRYDDGSHHETFEGADRLVTVKTVGYTGWKVIAVSVTQGITSDYTQMKMFALLFLFFAVFLLVFVNTFLSRRIATPIRELESAVKEIEKGKLQEVKVPTSGSYEVQHLGKTLNSMVVQLRSLMDDIVQEQESKRKSELDALQAQINPHFLYNTLDSVVWMVENRRYDEAVTMVTALARLFRISLSKGRTIIPVGDELEHIRNYLTIQQMRYKNKFRFTVDAEPETLQCATIKLIIQPLVENAIYHGMEFMDGDGEIHIRAYRRGPDLYIDIVDNGLGMPQQQADALLTGAAAKSSPSSGRGSGVGLRNVAERIRLYFGSAYGLSIYSEPDEGTTVRIHLPALPYGEEGLPEKGGVK